ncbi:MAG: biotin/lipoyl-binding protein [Christensenellales bacterium]
MRSAKRWKIAAVLVLAVGVGLFGLKAYIGKQAEENQSESASSPRGGGPGGAAEETVYGTGTTAARNQTHVLAGADGTLTDLRVSVGDEVKAGDILAALTNGRSR